MGYPIYSTSLQRHFRPGLLHFQMEQMQREMRTVAQQAEIAQKEKTHLQEELEEMDKQYQVAKARLTKHRAQREEDKDPKASSKTKERKQSLAKAN